MTAEEERILAWTLLGEAANQGINGMEAVAHVIRNRAESGRFPSNPASVALQGNANGIHQFSTWNPISQGGNIPRSRYPVESREFGKALEAVRKVFGETPGKDPTLGATHYYAPSGMPGGAPPYWWRSEARKDEKRIGGHIFATRREEAVAPTPASRGSRDPVGSMPSKGTLEVFRTGEAAKLPVIGPTGGPSLKTAPTPAKQSAQLAQSRGATMIYDPVRQAVVPKQSASDLVRAARSAGAAQPAKAAQAVAGFSIPGGVVGVAAQDAVRAAITAATTKPPTVSASDKTRAARTAPKAGQQTQFAVPQPNGSLVATKDQARLAPQGGQAMPIYVNPAIQSPELAAQRAGGKAPPAAPKVAPVPLPPLIRQPPPMAVPTISSGMGNSGAGSGSAGAQTIRGASTGQTFTVGQTYTTGNGDRYVATTGGFSRVNSDGSSGSSGSGNSSGKSSSGRELTETADGMQWR